MVRINTVKSSIRSIIRRYTRINKIQENSIEENLLWDLYNMLDLELGHLSDEEKHGYWVWDLVYNDGESTDKDRYRLICPFCKEEIKEFKLEDTKNEDLYEFCPHCGRIMDGEVEFWDD